jgi:hypothetical protein
MLLELLLAGKKTKDLMQRARRRIVRGEYTGEQTTSRGAGACVVALRWANGWAVLNWRAASEGGPYKSRRTQDPGMNA